MRSACILKFARRCGRGGGGRLIIPGGDNCSSEKDNGVCVVEGRLGKRVETVGFCIKEEVREGGLCCQPLDHEGKERDEASSTSNFKSEELVVGEEVKSGGSHDDFTLASSSAISAADIICFGL